jgi:hypothetical protein
MKEKEYIIDTISRSTLEENGFDMSDVKTEMDKIKREQLN